MSGDETLLDELKRLGAVATHGGFDDKFSFSYEITKHAKELIAAVEALVEISKGQQPMDYAKPLVTIARMERIANEALRPFKEKAK